MNIALIFAEHGPADGRFAAYRAPSFIRGLGEIGLAAETVRLLGGASRALAKSPARADTDRHAGLACDEASLPGLFAACDFDAVYSFGDVTRLASVWTHAAPLGCPLIHVVVSGDVGEIGTGAALRRMAWSRAGIGAKDASRHVGGLIGSSRAALGNHIESGFFAHARFSMITPSPSPMPNAAGDRSQPQVCSAPTLGHVDREGEPDPSWQQPPSDLAGVAHAMRRTSPDAVATVFALAYRRLVAPAAAGPARVVAQ